MPHSRSEEAGERAYHSPGEYLAGNGRERRRQGRPSRSAGTYFGSIPQSTPYSFSFGVFVIWTRSVPSIFIV